MSLTLAMTGAAIQPNGNDVISPDALNGSNNFWHGVAEKHGLIGFGEKPNNIKIIVAQGLTPDIATAHAAQVWGLVHDTDRRIPKILGQTLAKPEFSELPFVAAMRRKITSPDERALTA